MTLLDELLEAKTEFLQEEWDKYLIYTWKNKPYWSIVYTKFKFLEANKVREDDFYKLKRVPKFTRHHRCRVTRYIAAYLPTLSTHLWNGNKTDEELLKICSKCNLLNLPVDTAKISKESEQLSRTKDLFKKAMLERKGYDDMKEKTNRSNWGAAKR
jgi:hypothetical protein